MMDLRKYLAERKRLIDAELRRITPRVAPSLKTLRFGMRYTLFPGGKRLRPILALAACEAVGGRTAKVVRPACALELVHTFSLIHDDLPAMDDDDLRRGKPTLHRVIDEGSAILVGDALFGLAFEVIATAPGLSDTVHNRMTAALARATGVDGLVAGQILDLAATGKRLSSASIERIHTRKTAALFAAAVEIGAYGGGATASQVRSLRRYGSRLGLAFQIVDDILDIEGDEKRLGKRVGLDALLDKATYPSHFGIDTSRRIAADLTAEALEAIRRLRRKAEPLRAIAQALLHRRR